MAPYDKLQRSFGRCSAESIREDLPFGNIASGCFEMIYTSGIVDV